MAKLLNLARMTTATTGTGTITLGSAVSGYLSFASAGILDGDIVSYAISDGTASEIGTGTYTASGATLTRTVNRSTNANAAISLSGTAQVFITTRAQDIAPINGYLFGLSLSSASSQLTVGAGSASDSTSVDTITLSSAFTKGTGSWALGNSGAIGGLDTGSIANNTWYHVYLIKRPDTNVVDVVFSLNATSPALPTNYTLFRRVGSVKTNGSAAWIPFTQKGDNFYWTVPVLDVDRTVTGAIGTTATDFTLASTPLGVEVNANMSVSMFDSGLTRVSGWIYPKFNTDQSPTYGLYANIYDNSVGFGATVPLSVMTDTSQRIRAKTSAAGGKIDIVTFGWTDTRGRLA